MGVERWPTNFVGVNEMSAINIKEAPATASASLLFLPFSRFSFSPRSTWARKIEPEQGEKGGDYFCATLASSLSMTFLNCS
jgi:hypothetical protein